MVNGSLFDSDVAGRLLRRELRSVVCCSFTWVGGEDEYLNDRGTNMALLTMALKRMGPRVV